MPATIQRESDNLYVMRFSGIVRRSEFGAGQSKLGHTNCGAISAAIDTQVRGKRHHSRIQVLVDSILPALDELDPHLSPEALLAPAVEANVRWSMHRIRESPEGRERLAEGRMKLGGAIYEIETGRVWFLD